MLGGGLGARLALSQVPVLSGALEQVNAGIVSTMHTANERSGERFMRCSEAGDETRRQILFDPQTSGGLLIALPRESAPGLCDTLRDSGYVQATIIGEVIALASEAEPGATVQLD